MIFCLLAIILGSIGFVRLVYAFIIGHGLNGWTQIGNFFYEDNHVRYGLSPIHVFCLFFLQEPDLFRFCINSQQLIKGFKNKLKFSIHFGF